MIFCRVQRKYLLRAEQKFEPRRPADKPRDDAIGVD